MKTVNLYLNFDGNTEEAFGFYKSVFGGEFLSFQRFRETPEGGKLSAAEGEKLMHVSLPLGASGNILMGTDSLESMGHKVTIGDNFHISLEAESVEEAEKLFGALSAGGKIGMPLQLTFWNAYFGMCTDKFNVQWMVGYTPPARN